MVDATHPFSASPPQTYAYHGVSKVLSFMSVFAFSITAVVCTIPVFLCCQLSCFGDLLQLGKRDFDIYNLTVMHTAHRDHTPHQQSVPTRNTPTY